MTTFKLLPASDVQRAYEIEIQGFPEDEAASLDSLRQRQRNAPELFLGAYIDQELVGYACSTLTASHTLTHDSMSHHDFNGDYVALHSVCVSKDHQRKGIASALLKEYIARLKNSPDPLKGILLIAHEELVKLYQSVGFELVGKSDVQHGSRPWYEMKIDFDVPSTSSAGRRNPGKRRAHFGVIENLIGQDGLNSADVYCPRAQCRCLLLKRKTGRFVKSSSTDQQMPRLPADLAEQETEGYWSISSPLAFENIGFSNSVPAPATSQSSGESKAGTIKYLTCADCDLGPLGYHDTEGKDLGVEVQQENERQPGVRLTRSFLLDVGRVRYKLP